MDSDCTAGPLWLRELVPAFRDPSIGAVGGVVDSYLNEKGLDRYEQVKSSLNMGSWPKSYREDNHFFYTPTCNRLVKKELFLKVGGFRDDMVVGEDVDFCWRLQDQGHHVEYRPVGRIFHKHRNKLGQFCTRRFDYGTSEPLLQRSHPGRLKQFAVSRYYLFWAVLIFMWLPLVSIALFGMHLLTGIGEYIIKKPRLNFPFFFFYFTLDQLSYQLGVWWGCFKKLFFSPINPQVVRKPS